MFSDLTLPGADGLHLHALAGGTSGPVMLFLHGFPEFSHAWHRQLAEFARDHRAIALDLRGYNLSDKPAATEAYALPRIVADLRAVLAAVSPDRRAIVVGHDWGGIAAWVLARESPELLDRLAILNAPHPAIFLRELSRTWRQRLASSYAGFFQLRGVAETTLRAFNYAGLRAMIYGTSSKPRMFSAELRAAYLAAWRQPGALTAGLNYYRHPRLLKQLVSAMPDWRIDVRTLVLWGERDPALLRGNLEGLASYVPRLTLHRHPTATHWIHHEEPAWVNAALRTFLSAPNS